MVRVTRHFIVDVIVVAGIVAILLTSPPVPGSRTFRGTHTLATSAISIAILLGLFAMAAYGIIRGMRRGGAIIHSELLKTRITLGGDGPILGMPVQLSAGEALLVHLSVPASPSVLIECRAELRDEDNGSAHATVASAHGELPTGKGDLEWQGILAPSSDAPCRRAVLLVYARCGAPIDITARVCRTLALCRRPR